MSGSLPSHDELMVECDAVPVNEPMEESGNGNEQMEDWNDEVDVNAPNPPTNNAKSITSANDGVIKALVDKAVINLDTLVPLYTPFSLINRLQFIADRCPPLQREAMLTMVDILKKHTKSASRYLQVCGRLEAIGAATNLVDNGWASSTQQAAYARTDHLLAEFKKQKDEGVKESTRRAMEELFLHYLDLGLHSDALRLYNKGMRDYCSQFRHVMSMYVQWLECAVEEGEWSRMNSLLSQAERAINDAQDTEQNTQASSAQQMRVRGSTQMTNAKSNKTIIKSARAKMDVIHGLSRINSKQFKEAAEKFIQSCPDEVPVPWIVSHRDIATYGTLCALATFDRKDLKSLHAGTGDNQFKRFLETEPDLVRLLGSWVRSDWGVVLDGLEEMKGRLLLDPFVSSHVSQLFSAIRERGLILHLVPFHTIDIKKTAATFRCDMSTIEDALIELSDKGVISPRIDAIRGIAEIQPRDERQAAYERVLEVTQQIIDRSNDTIFKALLGQARVYVQHESRGKRKTTGLYRMEPDHEDEPVSQMGFGGRAVRRLRGAFARPDPQDHFDLHSTMEPVNGGRSSPGFSTRQQSSSHQQPPHGQSPEGEPREAAEANPSPPNPPQPSF
ncbi:unnamed protein product, partial [Mesorhabditis belari]|uniref:26S proteasome regulatory subunit Rpn7 N-terminal domain-containing protein n=1 Tax=Mesorhabditis belari TaxID=2138241 RepID=A0AAF3F1B2_9BILA